MCSSDLRLKRLCHKLFRLIIGVGGLYIVHDRCKQIIHMQMLHTYDEAKKLVAKALEPMGDEYVSTLKAGMESGWIDVYENENKSYICRCSTPKSFFLSAMYLCRAGRCA